MSLQSFSLARLASACLLAPSSPAAAEPDDDHINPDRPGIADGSTTVGRGRFQLETAFQRELREGGDGRTTFVPTLLRYGFADKWEVRIEGNGYTWEMQVVSAENATDSHGLAPTSIGLKYSFVEAVGSNQPSLGTIIRVFPPSGSGEFRNTRTTGDIRLAADWRIADK
ncbi:MAG: hypothetical protein BGO24_18930 [Sphingomonas sp. 67-36]|jgi:hypothetical protein|uniref:transporter n=1 Tax=Sphingomonas sp. TaxID=28214 RepID=UPI0009261E09|nr:transporter [Sphingomonas sp.]MBN8848055.1 transporter [Sphingomonas sp.]OJV29758.1 MAG: hypothetical protein BGO24_18930 [Sphingomonas sp. 67-36]